MAHNINFMVVLYPADMSTVRTWEFLILPICASIYIKPTGGEAGAGC